MESDVIAAAPCPACGHPRTKVQLTVQIEECKVRRRVCKDCDHRFYTLQPHEIPVSNYVISWRSGLAPKSIPELRCSWDTLVDAFNKDTEARIAREGE